MLCANCSKENSSEALFCRYCGKLLSLNPAQPPPVCSVCGAPLPDGAAFCASCGAFASPKARETQPIACLSCGAPAVPGSPFCFKCGVKNEATTAEAASETNRGRKAPHEPTGDRRPPSDICPVCKNILETGDGFCPVCAAQAQQNGSEGASKTSGGEPYLSWDPYDEEPGKKKHKNVLLTFMLVLLALVIFAIAFLLLVDVNDLVTVPATPAATATPSLTATIQAAAPTPIATPAASGTVPIIAEGIYHIAAAENPADYITFKSAYPAGADKNGTMPVLYPVIDSGVQQFRIVKSAQGACYIRPLISSNGQNRTLSVMREGTKLYAGMPVCLYEPALAQDQLWNITPNEDGTYSIILAADPSFALAYAKPAGENSKISLESTQPGETAQRWIFTIVEKPSLDEIKHLPGGEPDPEMFIVDLDKRLISYDELSGFSQTQMGYIRNGIYALSGKVFSAEKYAQYFTDKEWYSPYSTAVEKDADIVLRFNTYQKSNLELCVQFEKDMGWRK
ncbi:MAG: double zinc ribbon domain-containing protein [Christensenellales bacterium]